MRVAVNLLYLIPGVVGGTETYARGLVRALGELATDDEYLLFVTRQAADVDFTSAPNVQRVVVPIDGRRRSVRYAWEQAALPFQLRRHGADVVHSLGYVGPAVTPCPHVLTIPDLNYIHQPGMSTPRRWVVGTFTRAAARGAARLVTISDFSRRAIERHFGLADGAVTTTHLAGRGATRPPPAAIAAAVAKYGIEPPYVVAFSSTFVHKNIPRLLAAFDAIADSVPHRLVLIGHLTPAVRAALAAGGHADRVTSTGFVPNDDVAPLLAGADLLIFPSLYEGFGLPLLDAQELGIAVAASTAGSLPEVGGEGAAYFDPTSTVAMSDVMQRLLLDPAARRSLAERGRRNAERFTWERTAQATHAVYEQVARRRGVASSRRALTLQRDDA